MKKEKFYLVGLFSLFLILTLALLGCEPPPAAEPDGPGGYTECSYTTGLGNVDYLEAKIYYPCETKFGPFPSTTMTGGYTNVYSVMDWISKHLVTHGYIVIAMTPRNNLGTSPEWTNAHKAGISQLKIENSKYDSPIRGQVDIGKLQTSGYSKGGGGALLAASELGSKVKSCVAMAPYMDFDYNLSDMSSSTMILIGDDDNVANPNSVRDMYTNLPDDIERLWGLFTSFGHMEWDITASESNHIRAKTYITSWMKVHLDEDSSYEQYLDGSQPWFIEYSHNRDTPVCCCESGY